MSEAVQALEAVRPGKAETRLQALTANRLVDGAAVFWSGAVWAEQFPDAALFTEPSAAARALEAARALPTELVDPYLIEVSLGGAGPAPASYRERVRALGPTIHPDMGKQAVGGRALDAVRHAAGAARSSGRLSLIRRK